MDSETVGRILRRNGLGYLRANLRIDQGQAHLSLSDGCQTVHVIIPLDQPRAALAAAVVRAARELAG